MALLTPERVYVDGNAHRVALYRVLNANSLDTVDVGGDFRKIISMRTMQVSTALADFAVTPSAAGTVITLTAANLAGDAVMILVSGGAA
jgi:hypothetical protein